MTAPEGWYLDEESNLEWYWDGKDWTDQSREIPTKPTPPKAPPVVPVPEAAPIQAVPTTPQPLPRKPKTVGRQIGGGLVLLVVIGVIALVVALVAVGSPKHTIVGAFTLTDTDETWTVGSSCSGSGGYGDIDVGLEVTVKDGSGKTLAVGALTESTAATEHVCVLKIEVDKVPDADFYAISVGHRGELTYSKAEMKSMKYAVDFTLGGN